MRCPFPGMDPFLETSGVWEDFHRRFLDVAAEDLLTRLPEGFAVTNDRGRYERRMKYGSPELSGLDGERLSWVKSVLAGATFERG